MIRQKNVAVVVRTLGSREARKKEGKGRAEAGEVEPGKISCFHSTIFVSFFLTFWLGILWNFSFEFNISSI